MTDAEAQLYKDLAALGVAYKVYEHPAVFTVAESSAHNDIIPGAHTKNLFLKDKAGDYYLVTVPAEARVDLKALPAAVGCGRVSFGKAEDMERLLGITPGSVTALAAINDTAGSSGTANTGGGGGGGAQNGGAATGFGGSGGSGVTIFRYPDTIAITIGAGLTGSTATDGSFKVTTITAGTGNVSWA